jgi:hypothetical protein
VAGVHPGQLPGPNAYDEINRKTVAVTVTGSAPGSAPGSGEANITTWMLE